MISLLLPSRGRPDQLRRFYDSAMETASIPKDIEVVVYVDNDDVGYDYRLPRLRYNRGDRIILSQMWNKCHEIALGPIYGHMGDDIIFRTPGWDVMVKDAFRKFPDRIAFVYGDDVSGNGVNFGTHGFIHKRWIDTVGYFVPPYFSSDYNDTWLNDVSSLIDRHVYVDMKTEHMHFVFGKGEKDKTHEERLARHSNDRVDEIYAGKKQEREADAAKLRAFIGAYGK